LDIFTILPFDPCQDAALFCADLEIGFIRFQFDQGLTERYLVANLFKPPGHRGFDD
jgi:hypothetical protein